MGYAQAAFCRKKQQQWTCNSGGGSDWRSCNSYQTRAQELTGIAI
jgi:hypothetical protein